jgi:hypothetical protein
MPDWNGGKITQGDYAWATGAAKPGAVAYTFKVADHVRKNGGPFKQGSKPVAVTTLKAVEPVHKALVRQALKEGKPVPADVLSEYPDLQIPKKK